VDGVPNQPTVPTAHASPSTNPLHQLRRHIGRSSDGRPGMLLAPQLALSP